MNLLDKLLKYKLLVIVSPFTPSSPSLPSSLFCSGCLIRMRKDCYELDCDDVYILFLLTILYFFLCFVCFCVLYWFGIAVVQENNVKLRLNIVDTPGYGDLVNNENWYVLLPPSSFFTNCL